MKKFIFKMFLLITFLFMSNGVLLAQVDWTKYPGNPVFAGQPGTWYAYVSMNSVLYNPDSSRYEMWFTAGAQASFPYTIGFAWSNDSISWNVYEPNPVLTPTPGEWDAYTVLAPYVLRENGQYKMWYTGCATAALLDRIGYATSPDGIVWTKHPDPVLLPGTDPWESGSVAYGCVMPYYNGYKMWYGGGSSSWSETAIGYATSLDGITWEKYTGNPVLIPGASGQWDHILFGPRVLYSNNTYYMFYTGEVNLYQSDKIGLATSSDGLVWMKYSSNPVLQPTTGQWDGNRTILGCVLMEYDTLKMYYAGTNGSDWHIGLATSLYKPNLLPGTYTVGTGGYFATIQDAFNKLGTDGVSGNVTIELIDELYVVPTVQFGFQINGPIPGAGPDSRVIIKPAENKNVLIQGSEKFALTFINTSYVNIDGVSLTGPTTLKIHEFENNQYDWNACLIFFDNSDHNIVQNIIFVSDDVNRGGIGAGFSTRVGFTETSDSNIIQNNFIKKAGIAIYISAFNTSVRATGNIIKGNQIGSEADSLISWGIQTENCENTVIENNIIQNIKAIQLFNDDINLGINSYSGYSNIIRNNVVHTIRSTSGYSSVGILLSGGSGSDNMIYNNMIYNIQSTSTHSDSRVAGIQVWYNNNPKIYYNTIYLAGTGSNASGSAALYIAGLVTNLEAKNNIFVNIRDESPYCAFVIYDYGSTNFVSNYNDLYYDDTNPNNCLVRIGGANYLTLTDWQATLNDLNSYVEMPQFVEPYLHIDEAIPTYLESTGTPITGIENDVDGDTRNTSTPDIGADEFNGIPITDVEDLETLPTEFALEQNYPNPFNPSTKIKYSVPQTSQVQIKIYDILGNEIATLVNEEKPVDTYELTWNAEYLPSGVYFYQLKAGEFINTKKMILLK